MVDKPPIGGKELLPLTGHSLSGFRLNPGPVSVPNSLKHEKTVQPQNCLELDLPDFSVLLFGPMMNNHNHLRISFFFFSIQTLKNAGLSL